MARIALLRPPTNIARTLGLSIDEVDRLRWVVCNEAARREAQAKAFGYDGCDETLAAEQARLARQLRRVDDILRRLTD